MKQEKEEELMKKLFSNYSKALRPYDENQPVTNVTMQLIVYAIVSLSTLNQIMISNTGVTYSWKDGRLTWNPENYDNISYLLIPYHHIWIPDITLFNTAGSVYEDSIVRTNVLIRHTGEIDFVTRELFTSSCSMNVDWYPFDRQTCQLSFVSWTYDGSEVTLSGIPPDFSFYSPSPEFFLEDGWVKLSINLDPCCENPFYNLDFFIQLHRRSETLVQYLIIPAILINLCSVLCFLLPVNCGERIGLSTSSLLGMIVFLMASIQNLPPSRQLPFVAKFYTSCVVITTSTIVCSATTIVLSYKGNLRLPRWTISIQRILALVLFITLPAELENHWSKKWASRTPNPEIKRKQSDFKIEKTDHRLSAPSKFLKNKSTIWTSGEDSMAKILISLDSLLKTMEELSRNIFLQSSSLNKQESEPPSYNNLQCQLVVKLLDRIFFLGFVVVNIYVAVWVLTRAPSRERNFTYCPLGRGECGPDYDFTAAAEVMEAGHPNLF